MNLARAARTLGLLGALGVALLALPAAALNEGLGAPPPELNRKTPLAAAQGYTDATHDGDYALAAHFLDLDHLDPAAQREQGPRLARRLWFVLRRQLPINLTALSKRAEGDRTDPSFDLLGEIPSGPKGAPQPIRLYRAPLPGGGHAWVFSEDTVRAVDRLYEEYGPPFAEKLPEFLFHRLVLGLEPWQWLGLLLLLAGVAVLGVLGERLTHAIGLRLARLTSATWDDRLVDLSRGPTRLMVWAGLLASGTRALLLPDEPQGFFDLIARSLVIVAIVWFLERMLRMTGGLLEARIAADNPDARGTRTQLSLFRRVLEIAVYVVGGALFLLQFDVVRSVGVSLLASAGIATLLIGFAAQKSIGSLFAGLQLSITQPIRIGDSVLVEGEFGTVEEISLTYVIISTWDLRRMVIPITYFLEKPFQNWSKGAPGLLGAVTLELDFTTPVDMLRAEVDRLLKGDAARLWDGKVAGVQVTGSGDRTMSLRVLVSAKDPGVAWDLRCLLRERLIQFIAAHPEWLPVTRSQPKLAPEPPLVVDGPGAVPGTTAEPASVPSPAPEKKP